MHQSTRFISGESDGYKWVGCETEDGRLVAQQSIPDPRHATFGRFLARKKLEELAAERGIELSAPEGK